MRSKRKQDVNVNVSFNCIGSRLEASVHEYVLVTQADKPQPDCYKRIVIQTLQSKHMTRTTDECNILRARVPPIWLNMFESLCFNNCKEFQ